MDSETFWRVTIHTGWRGDNAPSWRKSTKHRTEAAAQRAFNRAVLQIGAVPDDIVGQVYGVEMTKVTTYAPIVTAIEYTGILK